MNPTSRFRISGEPIASEDESPSISPPFYVHHDYREDSTRRRLAHVLLSLINSPHKTAGTMSIVPESVVLAQSTGSTAVAFLLVGGYSVPVSRAAKFPGNNPDPTQEVVGVRRISQASVYLYVVESSSGEIIWDAYVFRKGGIVHRDKIVEMVNALLKEMP